MIEFYPQIKAIHIAAVTASGLLFLVRGAALHTGMSWPMAAPVRYLSYIVDTALLAAAITLVATLHQYPLVHSWLTVKVLLLVAYILLGTFALKRGSTRTIRVLCWVAALLVYAFIISVARAHHPAGLFASSLAGQAEPRGTTNTSQVAASRI
ncbi:SirB2 family protein [Steroidobacter sp. S1-65]|uniref:SirB2 family protein n=1 Tax=Steroidobacter gossypii TaxID=2805490 RepID=A0ABS1WQZ5_9GAMM|nr:SirB2 family protein [Steroidobacter gossypii]MBM0103387.1 SirB2 family protein [Steroidobacter gossypii]